MDLWTPPHDHPHLLEWWRPLLLASQRVRTARIRWPIHIDEFRLVGRVKRPGRPDIWIYEHPANGGGIYVDAEGETYKFTPTPSARGMGRFQPCEIRTAVWRAGLPDVVEPVWYDEPRRRPWADEPAQSPWDDPSLPGMPDSGAPVRPAAGDDRSVAPPVPGRRQRGHLTVIDCPA